MRGIFEKKTFFNSSTVLKKKEKVRRTHRLILRCDIYKGNCSNLRLQALFTTTACRSRRFSSWVEETRSFNRSSFNWVWRSSTWSAASSHVLSIVAGCALRHLVFCIEAPWSKTRTNWGIFSYFFLLKTRTWKRGRFCVQKWCFSNFLFCLCAIKRFTTYTRRLQASTKSWFESEISFNIYHHRCINVLLDCVLNRE